VRGPLFSYFGAKWRIAPKYPAPEHGAIVEPFAGSAAYACRYPSLRVTLVERDPMIAALWRYLLRVTRSELLSLPLVGPGDDVGAMPISEDAKTLIGFWLNAATTHRCRRLSAWGRSHPRRFWGEAVRARVADDVEEVRHWRLVEGSWQDAPNERATWFVDPPYVGKAMASKWTGAGKVVSRPVGDRYRYGATPIDYDALSSWCRTRRGLVIACETSGASWLPFRPFVTAKATSNAAGARTSEEVVWVSSERGQIDLPLAASPS
jgi:hypothetical protein